MPQFDELRDQIQSALADGCLAVEFAKAFTMTGETRFTAIFTKPRYNDMGRPLKPEHIIKLVSESPTQSLADVWQFLKTDTAV